MVCTRDQSFASAICARWSARLSSSERGLLLGFDIEWRPNYTKGAVPNRVALLQLAEPDGDVVLTRLVDSTTLHPVIVDILTHESVVLVGVGVKEDVKKLGRDFAKCFEDARGRRRLLRLSPEKTSAAFKKEKGVTARFVDLGDVARRIIVSPNERKLLDGFSLKKLAAFHRVSLSHKTKSLTMTNWEKPILHPPEIAYAAQDAECGLRILKKMKTNFCVRNENKTESSSDYDFVQPHIATFAFEGSIS